MPDFESRRAGMLLGSFVAESLSLGVHWIYDPELLAEKFGYVTHYLAPGQNSYHPVKVAGDQGHVGDQALVLLGNLREQGAWNPESFMLAWTNSWLSYNDYFDHATKTVLKNLEQGAELLEAASDSNELAGPARIAPLLAFLASASEAEVARAAIAQTRLTHRSKEAEEAALFCAKTGFRILYGADLESSVRELAPSWALQKADEQLGNESLEAIGNLGRACPVTVALPAVIYLILKHGDNFEKALSENAMAGGDNCARGLILGLVLGAHHGLSAIPEHLLTGLTNRLRIESLLNAQGIVKSATNIAAKEKANP